MYKVNKQKQRRTKLYYTNFIPDLFPDIKNIIGFDNISFLNKSNLTLNYFFDKINFPFFFCGC